MSISVTTFGSHLTNTKYIWMQRQQLGVSGGKATTPSICRHGTTADGISDAQESPVLRLIFEKAYQSKHNASISVTTQLTLTAHRKNIKSKSAHQKDGNPIILTHLPDPGSPHCLSSTPAQPRVYLLLHNDDEGDIRIKDIWFA